MRLTAEMKGTMFLDFAFTTTRNVAIDRFQHEHKWAQVNLLRAHLLARPEHLETFRARVPALLPARHYLGMQDIPVDQITGSVDRSTDFDHNFRPLKSHLRDRWVNIYLLAQENSWPPIRVYKVGEQYFVEDGHHRVSVARSLGRLWIQAEVWEYVPRPVRPDRQQCCLRACWCE